MSVSRYMSNLESALIKLRCKCKKDASKKLLPQEKEAVIVMVGMIVLPILIASITMLMN